MSGSIAILGYTYNRLNFAWNDPNVFSDDAKIRIRQRQVFRLNWEESQEYLRTPNRWLIMAYNQIQIPLVESFGLYNITFDTLSNALKSITVTSEYSTFDYTERYAITTRTL